MISKTSEQIYTMLYIVEQNNRPGYKVYMPTTPIWFNYHKSSYKSIEDFNIVDKRLHGWADLCIINKDGLTKYYKFIEVNTDKVYNGWLKKWDKVTDNNHFVVIYTNEPTLQERKYAIYRMNEFSQFVHKYTDTTTGYDEEGFYINKFYTKKCIKIQFDARTSTKRYLDIEQCMKYAIDNKHEYLLHKSSGFDYEYQGNHYVSLSQIYNNSVYACKYKTLDGFRKAFQRGTIKDILKSRVYGGASTPPYPPSSEAKASSLIPETAKTTERLGMPEAKSKVACLVSELNETEIPNQDEQMTEPDKLPLLNSMWRDVECWDISKKEYIDYDFGYLREEIEKENKNKVVTPIEVYKCKRA